MSDRFLKSSTWFIYRFSIEVLDIKSQVYHNIFIVKSAQPNRSIVDLHKSKIFRKIGAKPVLTSIHNGWGQHSPQFKSCIHNTNTSLSTFWWERANSFWEETLEHQWNFWKIVISPSCFHQPMSQNASFPRPQVVSFGKFTKNIHLFSLAIPRFWVHFDIFQHWWSNAKISSKEELIRPDRYKKLQTWRKKQQQQKHMCNL